MVDSLLTDGRLRDRGIFDDRAVAGVWREHRDGPPGSPPPALEPGDAGAVVQAVRRTARRRRRTVSAAGRGRLIMCGIAGIVAVDQLDQDAPSRAMRMRDIITHRGPDEAGLHCDAHAALAHRRLSIVDLSTGQQPLSNEDGSVWVVFNGEIYNHADIRNDLEAHGHRLPDEVRHRNHRPRLRAVGRGVRRTGSAACSPSRSGTRRSAGCCSCATASGSSRSTGRRTGDALLFGSEIKAILASGLVEPRRQPRRAARGAAARATRQARRRCSAASTSCCRGICSSSKAARITTRQYWDVPTRERRAQPSASPQAPALTSSSGSRSCSRNRSACV